MLEQLRRVVAKILAVWLPSAALAKTLLDVDCHGVHVDISCNEHLLCAEFTLVQYAILSLAQFACLQRSDCTVAINIQAFVCAMAR